MQPASQLVTAGQIASFNVTAIGSAPLVYQWQKNGTVIAGATAANYTTPPTTTSDSRSTFTVMVSNTAGRATSQAATLTVNVAAPGTDVVTYNTIRCVQGRTSPRRRSLPRLSIQ
jgi:hypothetical protein